nr:PA2169 family four-helix-bundle protein [uncultured Caldimonas sp.]
MNTALSNGEVVDLLNGLLETCRDGEFGFSACARHVTADELREVFAMRAADCQRGAIELETYISEYGGTPESGGSASGALHRGWLELKSALPGGNDRAMLDECARGEDTALQRYEDALRRPLPDALRAVVERQLAGVRRNREQIQQLRARYPG